MEKRTETPSRTALPQLAKIPLSRRGALVLGTAASLVVAHPPQGAVAAGSGGQGLAAADRFDDLRGRWLNFLVGGVGLGVDSPAVADRNRRLSEYAAWAYDNSDRFPDPGDSIWPDLPLGGPANLTTTFRRVLKIATAWATPGTGQHEDDAVRRTLLRWYRYLTEHWYHAGAEPAGNWWFWEIGIPRVLGDLTLILQDRLRQQDLDRTLAAIRSFTPDPNRIEASGGPATGANRADKVLSCLLRGIAGQSADDMALARDALLDTPGGGEHSLLSYATSGDGFYADGSYIHHLALPYAGTYGKAALAAVAPAVMLLNGTRWSISARSMRPVLESPLLTFAPFIWNGRMMETVRGRAVAREHERDYRDAWGTAEAVMLLAEHVDEPYRTRYRELAKGWLARCAEEYKPTTVSDLRRAEELLADDTVAAAPERPGHVQFGVQERMVHRGPGWAFTVATSSDRIGRYGWGNGENRYGWHQGDGASYLYLDNDQGQFADDYWPTVDPYRLPGTTASLAERAPGPDSGTPVPPAPNRWGGGVALSRRWGTTGMDLVNELGDVRGKKSWFLLDDSVVAVGSGIVVTGPGAETTVENRSFPAGATPGFVVDGRPVGFGDRRNLNAPRWAHLDGVAGYVFLGTYAARASVAERTGSWHDINSGGDTAGSRTPRTRTYATLSLTHPSGTGGDTYGYLILPGASASHTRAHAESGATQVLRKDPRAHVVRASRGRRWYLFAHLFEGVDDGLVRADGPCAVVATGTDDVARIAVSDPTKSDARLSIRLVLGGWYPALARADSRLTVRAGQIVEIEANLRGARGASAEAVLTT
ncbi:polysaccharide lyase 8 family protein [Myceligenerans pegani]|uniref:Polysaccharide lyase 8 family protein n=1 Tax=Myceligenerans pegani TaxID=2776917 RepID=A0ABR9MWN1_9MICO|nr:polysaccharide lyase 8 family protein [Myceligenerans sp. TRM 65318]MBE1875792.1 polysaccharide lyase 8 family protein [Myceligenerans sp. TRM 65318]MBE3018063.1 polysaccharide lyase 8 family protein [Myceligenerans sp. TRM 65318]